MKFRSMVAPMLIATFAVPAVLYAASAPLPFDFDPVPRWQVAPGEDQDLATACPAIAAECPWLAPFDQITTDIAFDEYYDKDGMLVGVHVTESTGCKPLDEHLLIGHAHFRLVFREEGKPDLDGMRMSLAPGVNPDDVRMVKASKTSADMGC